MEIKLDLGLQTITNLINMIWNMNRERMILLVIGLLFIPFAISSIWGLLVAVVWKLFCLCLTAGLLLFVACLCFQGYLALKNRPSRSLMDIMLSVLFEAGVEFPSSLWNAFMLEEPRNVGVAGNAEPEMKSDFFNPHATSASARSYSDAPDWSASTYRRGRY